MGARARFTDCEERDGEQWLRGRARCVGDSLLFVVFGGNSVAGRGNVVQQAQAKGRGRLVPRLARGFN